MPLTLGVCAGQRVVGVRYLGPWWQDDDEGRRVVADPDLVGFLLFVSALCFLDGAGIAPFSPFRIDAFEYFSDRLGCRCGESFGGKMPPGQ
jgi:hypothetical protein